MQYVKMQTRTLAFNKHQDVTLPSKSSAIQVFITEATEKSYGSTPFQSPLSYLANLP
jgi:hypothetical protein